VLLLQAFCKHWSRSGICSESPWRRLRLSRSAAARSRPALEERGHVVDAGDDAAEPGGGERRIAAPTRHVEHGESCAQVGCVDQALGDVDDQSCDLGEVAAYPGLLAAFTAARSSCGAVVMDTSFLWSGAFQSRVSRLPGAPTRSRQTTRKLEPECGSQK
jgi:hypothetical protein